MLQFMKLGERASDNCIRHVYGAKRESLSHKIKPSKTEQRLEKRG